MIFEISNGAGLAGFSGPNLTELMTKGKLTYKGLAGLLFFT